jgi:3-isopropylmalate dehydrogenase
MPKQRIAILAGDGIGPEVMAAALEVLSSVELRFGLEFDRLPGLVGGAAYEHYGSHFPEEVRALCASCAAILFGSVGGPLSEAQQPKWKNCEANSILALRKAFNFNANYRPAKVYPALAGLCPLKPEIVARGIDVLTLRELLGDVYFGRHEQTEREGQRVAFDSGEYSECQIASIAHLAFAAARSRRRKVTSVDKANVLQMSRLWRQVVQEVAREYQDVELEIMLVDNCAMQLILRPWQFDVVLTSNLFGDILSDEAAVFPGSLGLTPSASLNAQGFGMYEPSGGSAPDIAGQDIANPIAQILSLAMMLRFSFKQEQAASAIEQAVEHVLAAGWRTRDIQQGLPGEQCIGTARMGQLVAQAIEN